MIPFFDIKAENKVHIDSFTKELQLFMHSGQYIMGDAVRNFEQKYAAFCGSNYCVGTSNGLDALRLIFEGYKSLGQLQDGDEVLVPAHTYIATALAVIQSGLKPVFVEPSDGSFNMDVEQAEQLTTSSVKACLVVHLYGQLVDVNLFTTFAKKHGILLIEDAAQAHGAVSQNGQKAGAIGDAAAFSFYPTKNIGALGDAGAVTTNNELLAKEIKTLQNYGSPKKYVHEKVGFNMRLDALQARFLSLKLVNYTTDCERRIVVASRYLDEINNSKILLPTCELDGSHVFHLFVVRVANRNDFMEFLTTRGVGSLVHYPIPPHKQKALSEYNQLSLPLTEKYHNEVVSIPLYTSLSENQVQHIIDVLNAY